VLDTLVPWTWALTAVPFTALTAVPLPFATIYSVFVGGSMATGAPIEVLPTLPPVLGLHVRGRVLVTAVAGVALEVPGGLVTRHARRRMVTVEAEVALVSERGGCPRLCRMARRARVS
jgi:hypothetical protein